MRLRILAAAALAMLAAAPPASAQTIEMKSGPYTIYSDGATVTVDVADQSEQVFRVKGPTRIQYTAKTVLLTLGPPGPAPTPNPTPTPPSPPEPPTPPEPAWGPLERIIIIGETSTFTGREPFYSQVVRDAMTEVVPKDASGVPQWRCWDKDTPAPDNEWAAFLAFVKEEYKRSGETAPVLYAIDAQKRHRTIDMGPTDSDADVAARIRSLRMN